MHIDRRCSEDACDHCRKETARCELFRGLLFKNLYFREASNLTVNVGLGQRCRQVFFFVQFKPRLRHAFGMSFFPGIDYFGVV